MQYNGGLRGIKEEIPTFIKCINLQEYSNQSNDEKLYGPFVNLGAHLPPKDNSPFILLTSLLGEN